MLTKFVKVGTLGAFALASTIAFAQTGAPDQKQSNPKMNGRTQSESIGGENKNGAVATDEPQSKHKKTHIQRETNPRRNGATQSESPGGENKNGQPQ